MKAAVCLGVTLASALCFSVPVEAASLIVNGSFEDGVNGPVGSWRTLQAGNTDLTGWNHRLDRCVLAAPQRCAQRRPARQLGGNACAVVRH
jgi:hypothetical protein